MNAFEFAVAHDLGIGIVDFQAAEQGNEGSTLCRSASVSITAFLVQATFIADANGVGIVMTGMYADFFLVTCLIELPITLNVIMVADAFTVETGIVAGAEVIDREALVAACRRTVNDDQIDCTHDCTAMVPATVVRMVMIT